MNIQTTIATNGVEDVIRAIGILSDILSNGNTETANAAIKAAQSGRPAYWTKLAYHNQAASRFAVLANREGIASALAQCSRPNFAPASPAFLVASLIPLNLAARKEWALSATELVR